ncbi:MAG: hypothetical protein ACQEQO_03985 [Thermodesulfobacteriota bacterium]
MLLLPCKPWFGFPSGTAQEMTLAPSFRAIHERNYTVSMGMSFFARYPLQGDLCIPPLYLKTMGFLRMMEIAGFFKGLTRSRNESF